MLVGIPKIARRVGRVILTLPNRTGSVGDRRQLSLKCGRASALLGAVDFHKQKNSLRNPNHDAAGR